MQMKRYVFLGIVMLISSILLVACESDTASVPPPYLGGMDALVADFERIGSVGEGRTGASVWEDESFPVAVEFKNRGEYTIPANKVEMNIRGISQNDFSGIDFTKDNTEEIMGATEYFPRGGEYYTHFGDARYISGVSGSRHQVEVFVEFIYPYETYISIPQVCHSYDVRDHSVCRVDSMRQAFSSGGPLRVKSAEQMYIGRNKMQVVIEVEHIGRDWASMKARESDTFDDRYYKAYFEVDRPEWYCRSTGGETNVVRIPTEGDRTGVIRCEYDNLQEGDNHREALNFDLSYYYKDQISKEVIIKKPHS